MHDSSGKPVFTKTDSSNPWWALLKNAVEEVGGKLRKPEVFPASTDGRFFRNLGLPTIGFSPMTNTPILLHDHNEVILIIYCVPNCMLIDASDVIVCTVGLLIIHLCGMPPT